MKQFAWISHYRLTLAILLVGSMIAVALVTTGPVLIDQVLTFAFRRVLLNAPAQDAHINLSIRRELDPETLSQMDSQVQQAVSSHLGPMPYSIYLTGILPTLIPWEEVPNTNHKMRIQFYESGYQTRMMLLDGEWPDNEQLDHNLYAVVVGEPFASAYQLQVGDRIPLSKQAGAITPDIWLEVAAIAQPIDRKDPYWFGEISPLQTRFDGRFQHYGAIISKETFQEMASTHFSGQRPRFSWYVLIDWHQFNFNDIDTSLIRFSNLADSITDVNIHFQATADLIQTVSGFVQSAENVRTPLTFLTATTALLAFFFLGMVSTLSGDRFSSEWDLKRSRGVREERLIWIQMIRITLLLGMALLLSLAFTWGLLRALATAGPLAEIREPHWTFSTTSTGWEATALALLLCFFLILWPFFIGQQQYFVHRFQSAYRQTSAGWIQRYYVDVIITIAGLILLFRFVSQGGFIQEVQVENQADWLLVLAPIATIVGGLTILLRLFPLLLQGIGQIFKRRPHTSPYLALLYTARSHQQSTRLVILFSLTVALGIFSASVDDALTHNETLRARYASGGSVRLLGTSRGFELGGGDEITAVWRGNAAVDAFIQQGLSDFELLAIEPDAFKQMVQLRDSFAQQPVSQLLEGMTPPDLSNNNHVSIPADATTLGLWLFMPTDDPEHWAGISLEAKVATEENNMVLIPLNFSGEIDGNWRYFSGDLPSPPPARLKSMWLRSRTYSPEFRENLAYDDITVTTQSGDSQIIEGFEEVSNSGDNRRIWFQVDTQQQSSLNYFISTFTPHSGSKRLEFGFGRLGTVPIDWYGVAPFNLDEIEAVILPVLVSPRFLEETGASLDERILLRVRQSPVSIQLVMVKIVGVVDYFPTLYEESRLGYVVTLRDPLLTLFNNSRRQIIQPNELLLQSTPTDEQRNEAAQIITFENIEQTLRAFPLAVGLRTASLLSYILATAISLGGFVAHLVYTVSQRKGQFAVLRAIGLNDQQLYRLLLIEQIVLVLFGLLLGTGLGLLLTWLTLNNLNFDWGGVADAPPFEVVWDWQALGGTYLVFTAVVLLALGIALLIIRRTGIQRILRMAIE